MKLEALGLSTEMETIAASVGSNIPAWWNSKGNNSTITIEDS